MTQETVSQSPVVEVKDLRRRFGRKEALSGVNLSVPKGTVFGLVGENGAGKTTLIRHLLGMLAPQSGSVRVFGLDPVRSPEDVLARVGYLSEKRDIPLWMRVEELLRYTSAFYPGWDAEYASQLVKKFGLSPSDRLKTLSNGQQARAALITAVAHRPELLILDEPSAGLDAAVRRDILEAIIRMVSDEGRTVLFSSHLLDEVERVSNHVAMIHHGQIVMSGAIDQVKHSHRRLTLVFEQAPSRAPELPGMLSCEGSGREWSIVVDGGLTELREAAKSAGAEIAEEEVPSLEEIFIARVGVPYAGAKEA